MQGGFLCARHREWLKNRPAEAESLWHRSMKVAQKNLALGKWQQAFPHAGCAYDAARLMINQAKYCDRGWLRKYSASEALLKLALINISPEKKPCQTTAPRRSTLH